ncbi:hypothetical protein ACFQ9Z_38095 [Streptomyces sp. NPDC056580]|uniref:hypothetical protein n=1 Tax=Streptomyces sp. NPDC056580 TaxID=3345872 RepID=UPI0036B713D8
MHARARTTALATIAVLVGALTACSSSEPDSKADHTAGDSASIADQPSDSPASVRLVWSHTGKDVGGDTAVTYVARVSNPRSSVASVAVDARALDKTGAIVGSGRETLPNIPAHTTFDFLGTLGGSFTQLTGKPAKVNVSQAKDAFGRAGSVEQPMLATSELKLTQGSRDDLFTNDPYSYNLTVKVTNSTHNDLQSMVTQQVILYNAAGQIVGGDTGSSDNVPDSLPTGMSYREQWTGIPALGKATRAVYTVWAG